MIYIKPDQINECQVKREWFGPEKQSLNLSGSFSSVPEILARIIRTFSDIVPAVKITATDNFVTEDGKEMSLAAEIYKQTNISEELRNQVFVGQFIHEMSHLRYTLPEQRSVDSTSKAESKKNQVIRELSNILEDKRIEQKVSQEFPGFNKFLRATRSYYAAMSYMNLVTKDAMLKLDSKNKRLMFYIGSYTLYPSMFEVEDPRPAKYREVIKTSFDEDTLNKIHEVCSGDFLDLSLKDIENKAEELYKLFDEEEVKNSSSSELSDAISSVMDSFKNEEAKKESIGDVESKVKSLLEEAQLILDFGESKEGKPISIKKPEGKITSSTDLRTDPEVITVQAIPKPLTSASYKSLSSVFKVRVKTLGSFTDREKFYYEQSEGELDEDELSRVRVSKDLFQESDFKSELGLDVVVLLDLSGSMHGSKIEEQKQLSIALADALSKSKGIKSKFYGHTTENKHGGEALKIYDFNGKDRLMKLNSQEAKFNNLDGYAIDEMQLKFDKNSKSKILMVISDGAPCAVNYNGPKAVNHVKSIVSALSKKGIQVLSVSLDPSYNRDQQKMYTNIIPFSSFKQTIQDIAGWITNQFSRYSRSFNF